MFSSALSEVTEDTVMVTHYVVVNAVVGAATGDDRVICFPSRQYRHDGRRQGRRSIERRWLHAGGNL